MLIETRPAIPLSRFSPPDAETYPSSAVASTRLTLSRIGLCLDDIVADLGISNLLDQVANCGREPRQAAAGT